MHRLLLTLALLTFFGTCARAQLIKSGMDRDRCNVAFIKGETGYLIDSITIQTSLGDRPYGFAFPNDTLFLNITIFELVDELKLETFAAGHAFAADKCWVDAPSADVHLSIAAGRTVVDSVSLSPMDTWYREQLKQVSLAPDITMAKLVLADALENSLELLMGVPIFELYLELPNLTREDVQYIRYWQSEVPAQIKKHPRFAPLDAKINLIKRNNIPGKLRRYQLMNTDGKQEEVFNPIADFWVLNIYDATKQQAREDHVLIERAMKNDSLFAGVPVISVEGTVSEEAWLNYQQTNSFSWRHYREVPTEKAGLVEKAGLFPDATYLLLNGRGKIEGIYDNIYSLGAAIIYRKKIACRG